jgi:hypothetical protein
MSQCSVYRELRLFAETMILSVFDLFIDNIKLVRCCVRKDAENSGCEPAAILKFYPKTGSKIWINQRSLLANNRVRQN